jgi:hypothetical protein
MPKRNYGFEKRQKELNRQRKQEEKRQRKLERTEGPGETTADDEITSATPPLNESPEL